MKLPKPHDLIALDNLVPLSELAKRVAECIGAVEKHERNAVCVIKYTVSYDPKTTVLSVQSMIKDKRPVKSNRNEEVLGDEEQVYVTRREEPGQQDLRDHVN